MNRLQEAPGVPSPDKSRFELDPPAYQPPVPRVLSDLNIPHTLLRDLMLRHLRTHDLSSFRSLSSTMKISPSIVQTLFDQLRKQQLIEVKGSTGLDYSFELTTAGRHLAAERSELCRYAGPAPVSLQEYFKAVKTQAAKLKLNRARLRDALADLIVTDTLLDQLGPALISQQSVFLYGPTGNGKSSYSERLVHVYQDSVVIPHALEVDGQIVILYDPVIHHRAAFDNPDLDPRWIVCQRPCVTAGGELVSNMLDLRMDQSSGTYTAPLQVKANNGIFVIDDFGRQTISPRELLNRWMVPLDRRVDYLSLSYGVKFQVPFELLVVFSTNLNPSDLADEAFLRRIPNKVQVGDVNDEVFDRIFEREAAHREIESEGSTAETLRRLCAIHGDGHLRACYPGDLCRILHWISEYEEQPIDMTKSGLERAVALYFARR